MGRGKKKPKAIWCEEGSEQPGSEEESASPERQTKKSQLGRTWGKGPTQGGGGFQTRDPWGSKKKMKKTTRQGITADPPEDESKGGGDRRGEEPSVENEKKKRGDMETKKKGHSHKWGLS